MLTEQQFWKWFRNNSDRLFHFEQEQDSLVQELTNQLQKVYKGLAFAFSNVKENGKREFIISADGRKELFPRVLRLVESAPSLDSWEIIAFRQPVGCFDVNLGDRVLKHTDVYFIPLDEADKLGVKLYIREYDGSDIYKHACLILLDSILGEYDVEMKIGSIQFYSYDERPTDFDLLPVDQLYDVVQKIERYPDN